MLFVKICGITRREDAISAADLGARALGFNFYKGSKRYIDPERAAGIIEQLPGHILRVGLFVNSPEEEIDRINSELDLDLIQFHGNETANFCKKWGDKVIRAFRVGNENQLDEIKQYDFARMIIIDSSIHGQFGGTGELSDWELAVKAKRYGIPLLLAGGLTAENVGEAIRRVRPFGVDVAGGVEKSFGIKDKEKIRAFMHSVRGV
ncbi:MAG: phosphoribosylanthranilate isomerase [Chlamydiae bacterium]|nr:MAG: phosphoribosylanthranilate isomerase [Chlamydiota bacterium]